MARDVRRPDRADRGRFARVEPRRRGARWWRAFWHHLPRKNCWTLAEHAADATPDGM
jgi:hypothetical protein